MRAFHASEIFAQLGRLPPAAWLEIEKRGGFRLNGLLVLVNPDFALRDGSRTTLYQWTSESLDSKNRALQQACDILYAMDHWKVPREETAVIGFGASGTAEPPATFSAEQLDEAKDHILETADEMLFPLPDPQTNKATEEAFEISSDETPCHRCNFLKACPKWQ